MIQNHSILRLLALGLLLSSAGLVGCNGVSIPDNLGELGDLLNPNANDNGNANGNDNANDNGNDGQTAPRVSFQTYATNTGGASGMAIRPSDGAVFAVNAAGLFGPLNEGDNLLTMTPMGATNLASDTLFDAPPTTLALAITKDGEFWIATQQTTVAVVPPEGGDAAPFLGLFDGPEIAPEVIVLVPDGFEGSQIKPGQLLFGQETTFSRLVQVDAAGDRSLLSIDNPSTLNRQAHHLAFGLDGAFYGSRGVAALTQPGLQTIATDGSPTGIDATVGIAADSFVVLANGDAIIRGSWQTSATAPTIIGILLFDAATSDISLGVSIPVEDASEADELVISSDGSMILLSRPALEDIVRVTIAAE